MLLRQLCSFMCTWMTLVVLLLWVMKCWSLHSVFQLPLGKRELSERGELELIGSVLALVSLPFQCYKFSNLSGTD